VQKRLNRSICRIGCGLQWAEGCTSSIVFARWRQRALTEGHVTVTCRITMNHASTATMRLMSYYFDHLLSLGTPTKTVAQTAKRFEPSTVSWAFHTIQPSSCISFDSRRPTARFFAPPYRRKTLRKKRGHSTVSS